MYHAMLTLAVKVWLKPTFTLFPSVRASQML